MKTKLLILTFFFLVTNGLYANEIFKETITKAEEFKSQKKYSKAIAFYVKAIKLDKENDAIVRAIYFDIADCFYKSGKNNMAIKVLKFSIYRYGAVKEDFITTTKLDKEFSSLVLDEIEEKYTQYRSRYVEKYQKEIKIQENNAYAVKPS